MFSVLRDFREFIGKGSAIDLAVGLIIGSALGTIIKSFVEELIIPLTGLISKVDFTNLYYVLKGPVPEGLPLAEARKLPSGVVLGYGQFFTVFINTLILAFAVFIVVRVLNQLRARMAAEKGASAGPAADVALLTEIRDLLKARAR